MLNAALIVMSLLLAVPLLAVGVGKLTAQPKMVAELDRLGIKDKMRYQLGVIDIVGAAGILAGLWYPLIGTIAAFCWMGYWIAASFWHIKAGDRLERMGGPVLFGFITVIVLGLHLMIVR